MVDYRILYEDISVDAVLHLLVVFVISDLNNCF